MVETFFFPITTQAGEKSGVSSNAISLPSGPGSIEGLGDSFQPMLNTGMSRYSVKLNLPRGVADHTPSLTLQYDSGSGKSPLGIGWAFGPGSIRRQTDKGIPRYIDSNNNLDDDFDNVIDNPEEIDQILGPDGEELVLLADGTYRARIERSFSRYRKINDYWEVDLKDGSKLIFGKSEQTRVSLIEKDDNGTIISEKIFTWLLEKHTDVNGNVIEYVYADIAGSDNQKYLKEIRYGAGSSPWDIYYLISFFYEDLPDWFKDYRAGFLVKTASRLKQVDVGVKGINLPNSTEVTTSKGVTYSLIRRYVITYEDTDYAGFLKKVTQYGSNGVSYLPPITFSYSSFSPPTTVSAVNALISSTNTPVDVIDNPAIELIDLNHDALPDILETIQFGGAHKVYLNQGEKNQSISWAGPQEVSSADGLAWNLYLDDSQVHLSDMNGDGLADLVHKTSIGDVVYYPNKSEKGWGNRTPMSTQDSAPPAPFGNKNVKMSDMDFNKRMDIVKSTDNGYSIWFNLENGKYSREVRTDGALHFDTPIQFNQPGVKLADINGDRMNDVVYIRPSQVIYAANMGHGRFATSIQIQITDLDLNEAQNSDFKYVHLQDINGDGLSDLVVEVTATNEIWYWMNLGKDEFSSKHVITNLPAEYGVNRKTAWADINGNGTDDIIYADSTIEDDSRLTFLDIGRLIGGSAHPNLLKKIDNGLGIVTTIHYKSSTEQYLESKESNSWQSIPPFPVTVVSKVETTTGMDLDRVSGKDKYIKEFTYRDGYYDPLEKAFRGFEQAEVMERGDASFPSQLTRYQFFTGGPDNTDNDKDGDLDEVSAQKHREEEALKGVERKIEVLSGDGTLFSINENSWQIKTLATGTDNEEIRFAFKPENKTKIYEGYNIPEIITTTFEYDEFGNVTKKNKQGAASIIGDEVVTDNLYINDTNLWILGIPYQQTVSNSSGTKMAESKSYYDGDAYQGLSLGRLTKGKLTRQEAWGKDNEWVNITKNRYDVYGNVIGIKDGNDNLREMEYDEQLHIFPIKETIHTGSTTLVISADYHIGFGTITQSTDFNGYSTFYSYDLFARPTKVIRPGDSDIYPTLQYTYTISDSENSLAYKYDTEGNLTLETTGSAYPSSITTKVRENYNQPDTFDAIQYVDGMGRKLALMEEGEIGFIVKGATILNQRGTPQYQFNPYQTNSSLYQLPAFSLNKSEIKYDATGREILRINPATETGTTSFTTQYMPLQAITINENSQEKRMLLDGLERLIEVRERNKGETYSTRYEYDAIGNLTKITDAQNNIKTMQYDGLSRKIFMHDPDKGIMNYQYDAIGNLTQTIDAKGQIINYTYDGANRILTEDYQDAANITPDVSYNYDIPGSDYPGFTNLKGQISFIQDLSGRTFFSYNNRGNPDKTVTRVKNGNDVNDYTAQMVYDSMDRVTDYTYPDSTTISYQYNNQSLLKSIPGFVDDILYEADGRYKKVSYSNKVNTNYTYDAMLRLQTLNTKNQSAEKLQNLKYTFDGFSNITNITDFRALPADSKKNSTQSFLYDDLNRLTDATGKGYGKISFKYDKIGNMTFKKSPSLGNSNHVDDPLINLGIMTYGGTVGATDRTGRNTGEQPGPHAITSIEGGFEYKYDDNGNQTYRKTLNNETQNYKWDFKDRLVKVSKEGVDTNYVYNYGGRRILKKVKEGNKEKNTVYVSKDYEIREGTTIKYIFAGDRRIAKVEQKGPKAGSLQNQTLEFQPGWNFFSLFVKPADPAISNILSPISGKYTEVYYYDTASQTYKAYNPASGVLELTELHSGKGYLINVTEATTFVVSGTKTAVNQILASGWNLVSANSDVSLSVKEALGSISGQYISIWYYDTTLSKWKYFSTDPSKPDFIKELATIEPGKSYWLQMTSAAELIFTDSTGEKTSFFHPDHLGSSNLITDNFGNEISSTEFYPFGRPRYEENSLVASPYKYTGKELDAESGLMYYEARYYDPVIGRFASVDPLFVEIGSIGEDETKRFLSSPRDGWIYAYATNNPIIYVDPKGESTAGTMAILGAGLAAWGNLYKMYQGETISSAENTFDISIGGLKGALAAVTGPAVYSILGALIDTTAGILKESLFSKNGSSSSLALLEKGLSEAEKNAALGKFKNRIIKQVISKIGSKYGKPGVLLVEQIVGLGVDMFAYEAGNVDLGEVGAFFKNKEKENAKWRLNLLNESEPVDRATKEYLQDLKFIEWEKANAN